ncbi:ABC transporter permease subunit [Rhodoluna sp.]|uniref:ABC transporter permease subunit n=1 Tax=Rhodoluna sp. TaxID=1969481 RepID=UPI0025F4ABA4|nr:ABC transporter permease subunit [Rhodoluna sp.]
MAKTELEPTTKPAKVKIRRGQLDDGGTPSLHGTIIKIILLGLVDAAALFAFMSLISQSNFGIAALLAGVTLLMNFVYLKRGLLPGKYLMPGLIFMAIFQVYVVGFSGYIAFTNFGGGHMSSKEDSITAIQQSSAFPVEGATVYPLTVVENAENKPFYLITINDDPEHLKVLVGGKDVPLAEVTGATIEEGKAVEAPGYTEMKFKEFADRQDEILPMRVFLNDGSGLFYKTPNGEDATQYQDKVIFNATEDSVLRVEDQVLFTDRGHGAYESADGEMILPGWRAEVGFDNFVKAVTNERIREPLLMVTLWTFAFALLTVFFTFAMGLGLAMLFNDERIRGRKIYRIAMVLPYAFPAFLSALIWQSMFNRKEGFINQVILGGMDISWLSDPTLAKVAVLLVNFWLGFPYMFLIATGALQSIPAELTESAKIDGASAWQQFRYVKLPLLLVSVSPLLIGSFAFNFNNFTLIYLVTGGGPKVVEADMNVGHTDILITLVYKIAFNTGSGANYGLASAFSILIFLVVGTISYIGFRRTRTLEDVN